MKFKTFMKIVFVAVLLGIGGTCYGCYNLLSSSTPDSPTPQAPSVQATSSTATATAAPPPAQAEATPVGKDSLRPFDQKILDQAGKRIQGDKVKDAVSGSVKVNLYQDKPGQGVNRAKVDLDRDDKWDEKWTFKDGTVIRQVAPNDDEKYTVEYELQEGRWVEK